MSVAKTTIKVFRTVIICLATLLVGMILLTVIAVKLFEG
jgi:hypothetical protein